VNALQQAIRHYQNPTHSLTDRNDTAQSIVAYISADVPVELIIVAGMMPHRIKGNPESSIHLANKYLKSNFNPFFTSIFDRILDLTYSFANRLILSNLDESVVRLFYYLREIQRLEPDPKIPPVDYFEFLHLKSETSLQYNRKQIEHFKQKIEQWASKTISDKDLWDAIAICNENRKSLAKLADLRRQGRVSGVDALQLIGTSMLMSKQEHNQLLQRFFTEYIPLSQPDSVRIYVEGSSLDNTQLYEMIESSGAIVVAEDSDWGNRIIEGQIAESGNPLDAITDFYFNRAPYPTKASIDERAEYCLNQAQKAQADGVIFFIYNGDQPALWDYPEQKKALDAQGIPSLYLPQQPYNLNENPDLKQEIKAFVQSISPAKERLNS